MRWLTIVLLSIQLFGIGMMGTNILEYRNASEGHSYFENRADILLMHSNIEVGARLLSLQPSRRDDLDSVFNGIDNRYIRYSTRHLSVTAGTFYESFGRGLTLHLFEDRRMAIDHKLDGATFSLNNPFGMAKVVHGTAPWDNNSKLQGFELAYYPRLFELGATYLDYIGSYDRYGRLNSYSVYGGAYFHFVNLFAEFSEKKVVGSPTLGSHEDGNALFVSADFALAGHSLLLEYKRYDNYRMPGGATYFNNPPPCIREPSFTLQSRYIHQQDLRGEQGFQLTHFGSYPLDLSLEFSSAYITKIDNQDDAYFEVFADVSRDWDSFGKHLVLQYQDEQIGRKSKYLTGVLHGFYIFDPVKNVQWRLEFQNESSDDGDDSYNHFLFGLEGVVRSGISVGTEFVMIDEEDSEIAPWVFLNLDILEKHSITLGYGKRVGGYTCTGGICRYEPAFEGFELSIVSSF